MRVKQTKGPSIPTIITRIESTDPRRATKNTLIHAARTINDAQSARTPIDTGLLITSNKYEIALGKNRVDLSIVNPTWYGPFVEFGTGVRGAALPAEYFPPGLQWNYGGVTGYRARQFFYPPIISFISGASSSLFKIGEDLSNDVIGNKE